MRQSLSTFRAPLRTADQRKRPNDDDDLRVLAAENAALRATVAMLLQAHGEARETHRALRQFLFGI